MGVLKKPWAFNLPWKPTKNSFNAFKTFTGSEPFKAIWVGTKRC